MSLKQIRTLLEFEGRLHWPDSTDVITTDSNPEDDNTTPLLGSRTVDNPSKLF